MVKKTDFMLCRISVFLSYTRYDTYQCDAVGEDEEREGDNRAWKAKERRR
jgi:hypothetical protein